MAPIVTLLTDFGLADSYVAEVKGVLLSLVPRVELVDVSHDIPPGDVRAGQYVLSRAWPRFPAGTVHLAVVDPGVGTERRALAAAAAGHFFVGPDNGLLPLPRDARVVSLAAPPHAAPTFHGRDLFAPAAAALANGSALAHLGLAITDWHHAPLPTPRTSGGVVTGEVVHIDRFGTLVTNIPAALGSGGVRVGTQDIGPLRSAFGDVATGALLAFVGSGGTIEIAARDSSAARVLNARVGTAVSVA
jgi:S-adenosylmethionine hydrolase